MDLEPQMVGGCGQSGLSVLQQSLILFISQHSLSQDCSGHNMESNTELMLKRTQHSS